VRLVIAFVLCTCWGRAWADGPPWRLTAAIGGGIHSTGECRGGSDCDLGVQPGTGGFGDVEVGARTPTLGVVAFVRYAHYFVSSLDDFPCGPNFSARVDDVYVGLRVHYWPVPWFRIGAGIGEIAHHEADRDLTPPEAGQSSNTATTWSRANYVGLQLAVVPLRLGRYHLELGADLGSAAGNGVTFAIGVGVRSP
jgi:hypothetical protein